MLKTADNSIMNKETGTAMDIEKGTVGIVEENATPDMTTPFNMTTKRKIHYIGLGTYCYLMLAVTPTIAFSATRCITYIIVVDILGLIWGVIICVKFWKDQWSKAAILLAFMLWELLMMSSQTVAVYGGCHSFLHH